MKVKPYFELSWRKHRNPILFGLDLFQFSNFHSFDNDEELNNLNVIFVRFFKLHFYVDITWCK